MSFRKSIRRKIISTIIISYIWEIDLVEDILNISLYKNYHKILMIIINLIPGIIDQIFNSSRDRSSHSFKKQSNLKNLYIESEDSFNNK